MCEDLTVISWLHWQDLSVEREGFRSWLVECIATESVVFLRKGET